LARENKKRIEDRADTGMLRRTVALMALCGILVFLPLIYTLYKIQIRDHDIYEKKAVEQQTGETKVSASRGQILDSNGNILAISASAETVFISPKQIQEDKQDVSLIASGLSQILDVDYDSIIKKAADTNSQYKTIKTKIEKDLADEVRKFINENSLTGIYLAPDTKRYYPFSTLASHVVGFVGFDNYGLEGIEALYDKLLAGTDGYVVSTRNGKGTEMLYNYENYYDGETGNNVVLTIDSTIQYFLEKQLEAAVEDYDVQNGAAGIIMNVNTGEILAMATVDSFDLNEYNKITNPKMLEKLSRYSGDEYNEKFTEALFSLWRNKAVADTYEPGSTFKIMTLAMALEEGAISPDNHFYCSGSMDVVGRTQPVHCWRTWGHGDQDLATAVQNSCNMAFVQIGLRVGAETFWKYAEAFGFFDKTGIDVPGESASIWWKKDYFTNPDNLGSLAVASFGQTFNITPIQLITAASAACNGGYLLKPYVVKSVTSSDGTVVESHEPTVTRQVISEETSKQVCEILEGVVAKGTGKGAQVTGYKIAGKTGTSEKVGQQNETDKIVSFLGIAPADDPQIAVLVMMDTPSTETGIYISGGQMAAPTVGKILADVLPYMGIEPDYTEEELARVDITVPEITGLSLEEAMAKLDDKGLGYRIFGNGETVTDQLPASGSVIPGTADVIIYLGAPKPTEDIAVPNIYGMTEAQAKEALEERCLFLRSSGAAGGTVSNQSIAAGVSVAPGTVVTATFIDTSVYD
jgi:stage V sporulation protein D (sporulation-specific penicillin-binding protein)